MHHLALWTSPSFSLPVLLLRARLQKNKKKTREKKWFSIDTRQFSFCCSALLFSFLQSLSIALVIPSLHFGASHAHQERSAGTDWPHRENAQANSPGKKWSSK